MSAFFSGTDIQELHNNVDKYDGDSYYLSLIVNFSKQYVAKIVKLVTIPANSASYVENGETFTMEFPEQKVMRMFDLDVKIEENIVWDDDILQTRINELKAQAVAKKQASLAKTNVSTTGQWVKNKQGTLEFSETQVNYYAYLRMVLECSETPTKEIGQSLIHLTQLNADDFDKALENMYAFMHETSFDAFGYGNMIAGLTATKNILNNFKKAPKWETEVIHIMEEFDNVIKDMENYMSEDVPEDVLEIEEFTL